MGGPAWYGRATVDRITASKPSLAAIALIVALARPGLIRTGRPWV